MTNEEAIEILNDNYTVLNTHGHYTEEEEVEALQMAIKALEQEPILDKIRAEIDQKQYDFMDDKDYDEGIRFGLMLAYQILDKYKAESEAQNADSD